MIKALAAACLWPATCLAEVVDLFDAGPAQLNGDAAIVGDTLQLVPPAALQSGSAFLTQPICLATFSTTFTFQISDPANTGADGLALVIHPQEAALGELGGGLGYFGLSPSLAIEFDTFGNAGDINDNHLAVVLTHPVPTPMISTPLERQIEDGAPWYVWVDYADGLLQVRWSDTNERPAIMGLLYPVDLAEMFDSQTAYIGFTAATGAAWADHRILSWSVEACSALLSKSDATGGAFP